MKLRVKLYGTFARRRPGYQASRGLEVEIPPEMLVKDLLSLLEIDEDQGGVVLVDGRILKSEDSIPSGVEVQIFQSVHGG